MSANNFILVNKKTFIVSHCDADTCEEIEEVGKGKSLEEALEIADQFQQANQVEYGIRFV